MLGTAEQRLLADFRGFAGRRLRLLWLLMIAGAFAEALGIAILVPMLVLLSDGSQVPIALRPIAELAAPLSLEARLAVVLLVFAAVMTVRAGLIYARHVVTGRLEEEYTADLQLRAVSNLAALGWNRASQIGLSGVQSLLLTEIPRCVFALHEARNASLAVILLTVSFLLAAWLSPPMAGAALLIILAGFLASRHFLSRSRRRGAAISDHVEQSSSAGFRLHSGLKSALAQGSVPEFLREYRVQLACLAEEGMGLTRDHARMRALGSLGAVLAAITILFVGHNILHLPLPILATLLVLFARMSAPAQELMQSVHGFAANAPAYHAVEQRLGKLDAHSGHTLPDLPPLEWAEIRLEGARYRHDESGFEIADRSLVLRRGEWIGLAGPSGSGKTTIADLLVGLLQPSGGTLLIDGRTVDEMTLTRFRRTIAYVSQSEMTFEGSVRRNLLAGGGRNVADDQLWRALALVGLDGRVRRFAEGLDSGLGDRGSLLSGGERQRLAMARAILREPRLIVLDEATSALDAQSETQTLQRLRELDPSLAVILVAHRPGPLGLCDRVIPIGEAK